MNPQAKELVWDKIRDENCKLCELYKEAQSVCLLGDGPVPNKIMVIGEAPGKREDDIAKPFAGVAGQYLDRILSESGLPRDSIYITNSVRCRPPDNRTPTRTEIKACSDYLRSEIEIVNPSFVLLLGNVALQAIWKTSGIMSKRGTSRVIDGITYFATIHPAAVLRNPGHETIFKGDLLAFARLVGGLERRPETQTKLIQNSRALSAFLRLLENVDTPIAFDVETSSLEPWAPGEIHTISFAWEEGKAYVISLEHPATQWDIPIERVYEALDVGLSGKKMVGHNLKFDLAWMKAKGVNLYGHFDTKLAAHLLDENRPQGLKPLSRTYLGAGEYEAGITFDTVTGLTKLAIYNGKDSDYTLRIYHIFRKELKEHPRLARLFIKLSMPACRAFVDIEANGFPVDIERLNSRHQEALQKIDEITTRLLEYVSPELKPTANFRSPQFLSRWLFGELNLPIIQVSAKTNKPSTAESVLLQIRSLHQAADLLMELRKWQKYESTYTRNWLTRISRAGKPRLYTSYNLSGTVTGRLSSDMQQVPRDLFIRSIIGAEPGWKLVEADFSQIELRIAAMFSKDPALNRAFNTGGDPHRETAARVLGKEASLITKEERKMAKAVNFGFLYGMGARKFKVYAKEKYGLDVSDKEAQDYRKAFFDQYKSLSIWHERQRRLVRNLQQVQSPIGRVRHLPAIMSTDEALVAEAEREAINSPVQGLASDLTVLSMVLLHQLLDTGRGRIIGNVHDSILLEVREDYVEETTKMLKEVMEHLPLDTYFGFKPSVPIQVDITVRTHWGED